VKIGVHRKEELSATAEELTGQTEMLQETIEFFLFSSQSPSYHLDHDKIFIFPKILLCYLRNPNIMKICYA